MNSLVLTHVADTSTELCLDAALARLGAYIDEEAASLSNLLRLTGNEVAIDVINTLHTLHLEAGATEVDIRQLLAHAHKTLGLLADHVGKVPLEASCLEHAPVDFSAWYRWSGARLQDITATLYRAVAA